MNKPGLDCSMSGFQGCKTEWRSNPKILLSGMVGVDALCVCGWHALRV